MSINYYILHFMAVVSWLSMHPIHLSVTEINYNKNNKDWQISVRLFEDDLQEALQRFKDNGMTENKLSEYIQTKIMIENNGEKVRFSFIGSEIQEDARWSYFLGQNKNKPGKIRIQNKVFFELFDDQMNIIHLTVNHYKKSFRLNSKNNSIYVDINK